MLKNIIVKWGYIKIKSPQRSTQRSEKKISENKIMVSYLAKHDYNIIKKHGLDFIKIANLYKDN